MPRVLCVDFGSTFTKAALVDTDAGALLASREVPTTIAHRRPRRLPRHPWPRWPPTVSARRRRCSPAPAPGGRCAWRSSATSGTSPPRPATGSGLSAGPRSSTSPPGRCPAPTSRRCASAPRHRPARRRHRRRQCRRARAQRRRPRPRPVALADRGGGQRRRGRGGVRSCWPPPAVASRSPTTSCRQIGVIARSAPALPSALRSCTTSSAASTCLAGARVRRDGAGGHPDAVLAGVQVLADAVGPATSLVVDVGGATTDVYSACTRRGRRWARQGRRGPAVALAHRGGRPRGAMERRGRRRGGVSEGPSPCPRPARVCRGAGGPSPPTSPRTRPRRSSRPRARPPRRRRRGPSARRPALSGREPATTRRRRVRRRLRRGAAPRPDRRGAGGRSRAVAGDHAGGWRVPRDPAVVTDTAYLLFAVGLLAEDHPEAARALAGRIVGVRS